MKKGLLAGTFDPPTVGHVDVLARAAKVCDVLVVGVAQNPDKGNGGRFSMEQRLRMARAIAKGFSNIEVVEIEGLTFEAAKKVGASFLVRGLRSFADFAFEQELAATNLRVGGIETLFLMGDQRFAQVSSTLVRELIRKGEPFAEFVPGALVPLIKKT